MAAAAGIVLLVLAVRATIGTALFAPLGIIALRWWSRRSGAPLSFGRSWIAATGATGVGILLAIGAIVAVLPADALARARAAQEAESKRQAEAGPPEWLSKISPEGAKAATRSDPTTERIMNSRPFTLYFGLIGGAIACAIAAAIAGTLGWGASLLLAFAATGRWPERVRTLLPGDDRLAAHG